MSLRDDVQNALGDGYLIERELGRGGMGAVFLARDVALERPVAVKALPPELAVQPQLRERFLRETRTVAGFSHPNIVPVHAVVERGHSLLYVMGYVDGETLTQRVRRGGPLTGPDAVRLIQELAWALAYAHGRDVVHRDVKPDNVILERATGRALLTDFGIARGAATATALTSLGEVVGTPQFMSPEQAAGEAIDGRSDLYALGVTAFFAVTGRLPFDGPSTQAILAMQITQPAPPVAELRPDLPPALTGAIDRCLAKDPADRFPSGEALVEALEPVRASVPQVAPPVRQFLQQGEQSLRMFLLLALLLPLMLSRIPETSDVDRLLVAMFVGTMMAGVLRGVVVRARALVRQGFRHPDVRDGATALVAEHAAAMEAIRADPVESVRRRRERIARLVAPVAAIALFWLSISRFRIPLGDGRYGVTYVGVALALVAFGLVAFALVSLLTEPGRRMPLQRAGPLVWRGPVGRIAFRLAERGIPADALTRTTTLSGGGSTGGSPLTLLDTMPRELRRDLDALRPHLERLDGALEEGRERQRRLDLALAEARQVDPALASREPGERRRTLLAELAEARRVAGERHVAQLEAREAVRLQLLRLRSGLGSAADVRAELDLALAVAAGD